MPDDTIRRVQQQFGATAHSYVTSETHRHGGSLPILRDVLAPQPSWRVLDVATGGGHTARTLAETCAQVIASDVTHAMLRAARADQPGSAVAFCQHDAARLPFPAATFDAVTCRIAAHHFAEVPAFVAEAVRVLRPGGWLAIADNVVSGEPRIARAVNVFEALRDPSHVWEYSLDDWETFLFAAGLRVTHREILTKEIDFDAYAARMRVTGADYVRLRALLLQGPEPLREWLRPRAIGQRVVFTLSEGVIVGQKANA